MGFSKKTGKGRLDKYYFLAKDQGYRARSAFKLVQLHKRYNLLDQARVVIDLCAAPGGWLQVAAKYMPVSHVIVGVDLVPIKPIPGVKTIVGDITSDKCRSDLKRELKTWKADVVLHDGAPNVGKSWVHDAYSQSELVMHALKLATEFLGKDGTFVSKVFRSKDYNAIMWVFNQLFNKVEATKPASSRSVSAEIFVVCRGFKAPAYIDPRLLDPKHVFEDLATLQNGAKTDLEHPEKKRRHREGYEDGVTILYKAVPLQSFIHSNEPNNILATASSLVINPETDERIVKLAQEGEEILDICRDLKVIGRREFKLISRWRKAVRKELGIETSIDTVENGEDKVNVVEEDPLDELESLVQKRGRMDKKEKRKALERKAKQRMRLQLSMGNADDLADEYAANEPLFSLKGPSAIVTADNDDFFDGDSSSQEDAVKSEKEDDGNTSDLMSTDDELHWEEELEHEYEVNKQRELERDHLEKARRKLGHPSDGDADTDEVSEDNEASDVGKSLPHELSLESEESGDEVKSGTKPVKKLTTSLLSEKETKAEADAKMSLWYANPLFKHLEEALPESSKKKEKKLKKEAKKQKHQEKAASEVGKKTKTSGPGEIVFVKADAPPSDTEEANDDTIALSKQHKEALLTPDGMTLAAKLSLDRKRSLKDAIDESFSRYAFKDDGELPKWFLEDERKHNKPQKPITKEGIAMLKSKQKQLDAMPIKKVLEAKGRHQRRAMRQLEGLKRKAAIIADSEDVSERQKSEQIQKLLAKAKKPQRRETKLVIAKGKFRGVKGRPNGVKGHYKMVDRRMLKEVRAQKRAKNGKRR